MHLPATNLPPARTSFRTSHRWQVGAASLRVLCARPSRRMPFSHARSPSCQIIRPADVMGRPGVACGRFGRSPKLIPLVTRAPPLRASSARKVQRAGAVLRRAHFRTSCFFSIVVLTTTFQLSRVSLSSSIPRGRSTVCRPCRGSCAWQMPPPPGAKLVSASVSSLCE